MKRLELDLTSNARIPNLRNEINSLSAFDKNKVTRINSMLFDFYGEVSSTNTATNINTLCLVNSLIENKAAELGLDVVYVNLAALKTSTHRKTLKAQMALKTVNHEGGQKVAFFNMARDKQSTQHFAESPTFISKEIRHNDELLTKHLEESRKDLLGIAKKLDTEIRQGNVKSKFGDTKYVVSLLEEITDVALKDVNAIMRLASAGQWKDIAKTDFELELGKNLPKNALGIYANSKFSVDIDGVKEFLERFENFRDKQNRPDASTGAEFSVFRLYQITLHEAFHSVQHNRLDVDSRKKRSTLFKDSNSDVFIEGSAKFVERYAYSLVTDEHMNAEADKTLFLKDFKSYKVAALVHEASKDIIKKLKTNSDYDQGDFIFTVRYEANNKNFLGTISEICSMARSSLYSNRDVYNLLDRDISAGYVRKLAESLDKLSS